jgi:hypothetical protein
MMVVSAVVLIIMMLFVCQCQYNTLLTSCCQHISFASNSSHIAHQHQGSCHHLRLGLQLGRLHRFLPSQANNDDFKAKDDDFKPTDDDFTPDCTMETGPREVNVDLEFPYGTSLKVLNGHQLPCVYSFGSICFSTRQTCEVRAGTNGKPMIKYDAPDGIKEWTDYPYCISCAFHVVFPGHSDGCDCRLETYSHSRGGLRVIDYYHVDVTGCDCLRITGFECDSGCPTGLVWPCQDNGCFYAPQMKIHVDAN